MDDETDFDAAHDSEPNERPLTPEQEQMAQQFAEQMDTALDGIMFDAQIGWDGSKVGTDEAPGYITLIAYDARMHTARTSVTVGAPLFDISAETVTAVRADLRAKAREAIKALLG